MPEIVNFGQNIRFSPAEYYEPKTEVELLTILRSHNSGTVRVVGSLHSWSETFVSDEVLINLRHFNAVEVHADRGEWVVTVGGGCQVKDLLAQLQTQGLTLPSVGLVTEQTIAGATATGTHGSGKSSLSNYLKSVRIACFRDGTDEPALVDVSEGDELRAARCSLGCLGVVVSVELPCIPEYRIRECARFARTIEEALSSESHAPLQQFYLFPHLWRYGIHERTVVEQPVSWSAPLYRLYWWLGLDIGLHLLIKLFAAVLKSRMLIRGLFRYLLPWFVFPWWKVVDRSDRILVMEHELFRHLELEAFVSQEHVTEAARFLETVVKQADGTAVTLSNDMTNRLRDAGLLDEFAALQGVFTHHYPICFRRILRDETLVSMASGNSACWYSISFITYVQPREPFYQMAQFIAKATVALFAGRIHWGKWFPLDRDAVEQMYPEVETFSQDLPILRPQRRLSKSFCGASLRFAPTHRRTTIPPKPLKLRRTTDKLYRSSTLPTADLGRCNRVPWPAVSTAVEKRLPKRVVTFGSSFGGARFHPAGVPDRDLR